MTRKRLLAASVVAACLWPSLIPRGNAAEPPALQLPGVPAFDAALQQRLRDASTKQSAQSPLQATDRNPDGTPKYINRLVFESSPYLQQHAFNPVNWYPWGEEAFAAARRENKPVFLSIGYSTCHWCHVMEHECFENEAIARQLNEHFIAIKVDREERPDIDTVYVAAVQRMSGSAGWPLSVFLTPDRKPFYGGTYFPPDDRFGKPGFPKLLGTLQDAWTTRHEQAVEASAALTQSLQEVAPEASTQDLTAATLHKGYEQLTRAFDPANGGFGGSPKFPQAHMLSFLLRYASRSGEKNATRMALETLDHMARGGIQDQLGGGFHRYSTDAQWRVPHFEKMLYDQAINARAYLEASQATGERRYGEVARAIFGYVLQNLTAPSGGFFAAEDADSGGGEGRFYTWTRPELLATLGPQSGLLLADLCGVTESGVLPDGRSPLSTPIPVESFIKQHGLNRKAFGETLTAARTNLLAARNQRPRPLRDEKIITAWNGLMISSLAYGSTVLGDPRYAAAAARAADFVLTHAQRNGRLVRSFRGAPSSTPGYLDDYAFFVWGLTDLYTATFEVRWLREAIRLADDMLSRFTDPATGGLRYTPNDAEALITPVNDSDDAALPAARSVAAMVLLQLGRLTMNDFGTRGRAILATSTGELDRFPTAHTQMLMALDFAIGPTKEIVIAGAADADATKALLAVVRRHYLPRSVMALHPSDDRSIEALVPFLKQQTPINDKPTAYVCENYVCKLPTNDPQKLDSLLGDGTTPAPKS